MQTLSSILLILSIILIGICLLGMMLIGKAHVDQKGPGGHAMDPDLMGAFEKVLFIGLAGGALLIVSYLLE